MRSPGEFVCSAKHLGATETNFNYDLEGSLISDHEPWGLTSNDELVGDSDLAPCHPAPNSQVPPAHFSSGSSARFWPEWASGFPSSPLATGSFQSPELTELSWQRQAVVPASLTGFLFAIQFWHFADAFYFHVKSVINIF